MMDDISCHGDMMWVCMDVWNVGGHVNLHMIGSVNEWSYGCHVDVVCYIICL